MTVRRGFTIKPGEKILVVEDVITTGGSTRECITAIEKSGANVIGAACIIDRSNGSADVGVPLVALVGLDVPSYTEDQCPMCFNGDKPYKPGSRK
jgi:orotate phosphoribosyltransferase